MIFGAGPGHNGQVVDPFHKYWGCTFANQVCELATKKTQLVQIRKYTSYAWRYRATDEHLRDLQGESVFNKFPKLFGRGLWKSTMAPWRWFGEMVHDLIGKWLIHVRNIGDVLLPIRSVSWPTKKQMVNIRGCGLSVWRSRTTYKHLKRDPTTPSISHRFDPAHQRKARYGKTTLQD